VELYHCQQVHLFVFGKTVPDNCKMNLGERIKQARERAGLTQAALAKAIGIKQQSLSALEAGKSQTTSKIVEIAFATKAPVAWLAHGTDTAKAGYPENAGERLFVEFDENAVREDGQIPESDQVASYSLGWLYKRGIDPGYVRAWAVTGDAMSPTLLDGDSVAVDTGDTEIVDGRIYAIALQETVRLRRLRHTASGALVVMCDNPDKTRFPDEVIDGPTRDHFRVIGKAVHRAGALQ
jgi:transcriptional regulator with XRE-family HTH domain